MSSTSLIRVNFPYKLSPARWEEPRCYWRASAVGEGMQLRLFDEDPSSDFEFRFRPVGRYYHIVHGTHYVGLSGRKLVLHKDVKDASTFELHKVGPYYAFGIHYDGDACLIESESGNLGHKTDLQVWKASVPTDTWKDGNDIPSSTFRHLWTLQSTDVDPKRWMSTIADDRHLHEMAICGTHDTCTWNISWKAAAAAGAATGAAAGSVVLVVGAIWGAFIGALTGGMIAEASTTQWFDLSQQLGAGIRYLDIRLHDNLMTYHAGIPTGVSFAEVLKAIAQFLAANPSETVIMQVKREGPELKSNMSDEDYRDQLNHVMDDPSHGVSWHTRNEIPMLGDVRGRIVLVRRYHDDASSPRGIDLSRWPATQKPGHPVMVGPVNVEIQDTYKPESVRDKERLINGMLSQIEKDERGHWYINFASAANGTPWDYAKEINPWLGGVLDFQRFLHGVIMLDYPSPSLIERIIRLNDPSPAPGSPAANRYRRVGPVGTSGQSQFDDTGAVQANHDTLRRIDVHAGAVIDGIQAFYDSTQTALHGYRGGATQTFWVAINDPITHISGQFGNYFGSACIVQLRFMTRSGAQSPVYGTASGATDLHDFVLTAGPDQALGSLFGSLCSGDNTPDRYLGSIGATFRNG